MISNNLAMATLYSLSNILLEQYSWSAWLLPMGQASTLFQIQPNHHYDRLIIALFYAVMLHHQYTAWSVQFCVVRCFAGIASFITLNNFRPILYIITSNLIKDVTSRVI